MSEKNKENLGVLATVLIGIAVVLRVTLATGNLNALWALIVIAWGTSWVKGRNALPAGIVLAIAYGIIGFLAWELNNPNILWAMLIANWGASWVKGNNVIVASFTLVITYGIIGFLAWHFKEPNALWAMFLANWLAGFTS